MFKVDCKNNLGSFFKLVNKMLIKLILLTLLSVYATGNNIVCTPTTGTYVALKEEDLGILYFSLKDIGSA